MLSAAHLRKLKQILAANDTAVPIVVEGERIVYVREQGLWMLDRVRLQDVRSTPGDRIEVLLDGVLPLPGLGNWPEKVMKDVLALLQDAA